MYLKGQFGNFLRENSFYFIFKSSIEIKIPTHDKNCTRSVYGESKSYKNMIGTRWKEDKMK